MNATKEQLREAFDRAAKRVNFEKIHSFMVSSNWKWGSSVPNIDDLKEMLEDLFLSVFHSPRENTRVSCGGFSVMKWTWVDGVEIQIVFALEDISADVAE